MKSRRTVRLLLRQPELIEIVNKLFDMMINSGKLINFSFLETQDQVDECNFDMGFHSWKHMIGWMGVILERVKIGIFDNMYG
jgi:hypothetical protein